MDFLPDTSGLQKIKSLLLLYLFVVRTQGDCPKPAAKGNFVLSDEALLLNAFPDNIEISLSCVNGYVKHGGTGLMKCVDGAWGDPDITCKKKDCGPPFPQPHMKFDMSQGTLFGAIIKVTCEEGYIISGASYKQCYNAGWTGRGRCEMIECDMPEKISNGKASWDSADFPKYGEYIKYSCDDGYTLIGKSELKCDDGGEYDEEPPLCQRKEVIFTTKMPTSTTPAPVFQDTTSDHKDTTLTESATPTVSLSARRGGEGILTEGSTTSTTTSTVPSSYQEEREDIANTKKDFGYTPVIISVVCVSLVVCIAVFFINKILHKRKGSYDTREDLKPELLQFQNL